MNLLIRSSLSLILALSLSHCASSSTSTNSEPAPNYVYQTFGKAKKVSLRYSGTTTVYEMVGHLKLSRDSRAVGSLSRTIDLVSQPVQGDYHMFESKTNQLYLNGTPLKMNILIGGSDPNSFGLFNVGVSNQYTPASHIVDPTELIKGYPIDRPYSHTSTYGSGIGKFRKHVKITPAATTITFQGRSLSAALIEQTTVSAATGNTVNNEKAYISDEVPGRILQVTSQAYDDAGYPKGATEMRLTSASLQ